MHFQYISINSFNTITSISMSYADFSGLIPDPISGPKFHNAVGAPSAINLTGLIEGDQNLDDTKDLKSEFTLMGPSSRQHKTHTDTTGTPHQAAAIQLEL